MKLYSVEVSLDILTKEARNRITGNLGRYNVVADLLEKTLEQRKIFLKRCRQLFFDNLNEYQIRENSKSEKLNLDISWLVVMCCTEEDNDNEIGFPLYEFTKVSIENKTGHRKFSSIAGMFSTYMHDYDRRSIEGFANPDKYLLSSEMWKILFDPNSINEYSPLLDNFPVFVFPKRTSKESETAIYMSRLGFCEKEYTVKGKKVRCFYENKNNPLKNPILKSAILSVGLVLVELTRPDLYKGSEFIGEFNRDNFTEAIKLEQENRILEWLKSNQYFSNMD